MADRSNVSAGSCLGMVAVAAVSTGVILASYHLIHRRLDPNLKLKNIAQSEQRQQSRTTTKKKKKKKKVRFTDDVAPADLSSDGDEYPRLPRDAGKLVRPALRKASYSSTHLAC